MTRGLHKVPNALASFASRHPWLVAVTWLALMAVTLWPVALERESSPTRTPFSAETPVRNSMLDLICANSDQTSIWQGSATDAAAMDAVVIAGVSQGIGRCYTSIWQDLPFDEVEPSTIPNITSTTPAGFSIGLPESIQFWFDTSRHENLLQQIEIQARNDIVRAEMIALPIAWVILLLVTRSVVASLVPLLVGVTSSVLAVTLTSLVLAPPETSAFALSVIAMLGLALGIDYGLLCTRWYWPTRGQPPMAIRFGTVWVAAAVVSSGALALVIIPVATIRFLALGIGIASLSAALMANTLVPAMARLRRPPMAQAIHWPVIPGPEPQLVRGQLMRRMAAVGLLTGLLVLAMQASRLEVGLTNPLDFPQSSSATSPYASFAEQEATQVQLSTLMVDISGDGSDQAISTLVGQMGNDPDFAPLLLSEQEAGSNQTRLYLLAVHPWEDDATQAAISRILWDTVPDISDATGSTIVVSGPLMVYGTTIHAIETWQLQAAGVASSCIIVMLWVVQRRLWLAMVAVGASTLSCVAALGALTLFAESGWMDVSEPVEAWVPVVMFCMLLGLGVDYHVFLTLDWGSAEERHGATLVVIASACIMIAVFGGLIVADQASLRQLGLGLALGVAIDAFIVRLGLYPNMVFVRDKR